MINGTKKTITINQGGTAKAIEVKIPKGLTPGKKIRLAGKGELSPNGGPAGNIYLTSTPSSTNDYDIDGNNILMPRLIKLSQALLGDTIEVVTPHNVTINLKVPPGTTHKSKMRVPGHGIPFMKGNACGDLFVVLNIEMPKNLTQQQQQIIEQLKKEGM